MIERVASAHHLLVACDFDGTLAPIVDDPDTAAALPDAIDALRRLARLPNTTVAVVSGRAHRELEERFGDESFVLIGEHGADRGDVSPDDPPALAEARRLAASMVDETPGSRIEHKGRSVVFHHRNAPEGAEAAERLRERAAEIEGLHLMEGKAVLEMSVSDEDKGTALTALRDDLGADAVFFIGDDVTDEKVFATLGDSDLGVKVGADPTAAHARVADPKAVADMLDSLGSLRGSG